MSGTIQAFVEYVDWDAVRLVFHDGGRSYFCETDSETTSSCNIQTDRAEGVELTIHTSAEPDTVIITVEDTGVGIPAEILENLFNPLFKTKDVNEGKGLELSIVHGIVKSHGGTIQAEGELGKRTRFVIKLPI